MNIECTDGVGLIPEGALLDWEDPARHKLKMVGSDIRDNGEEYPFNRVHPLTIGLTEHSRQLLIDSGAECWQLETVLGRTLVVTPHFHPTRSSV